MKKIIFFLAVIGIMILFVAGLQYLENQSYNRCMLQNMKYTSDTDRDCEKLKETGRYE